ncbi:MAG TPA: hypothetical protein VLU46_13075, partial [Thermoanaerobaculia bacterium]|nr:hypothetical protein [Thermoanaerobaculia bacterium]
RSTFLRPSFFRWMAKPAIACVWREDRLDALLGRIGGLALRERQRLVDGSESIRDVIDPLVGDADRESDLAFAERVVPLLVGGPADRLTRWCIESMKNGRPRERILDDIVTSREFAEANLRSGAVTVD